jgi:tetratricopeptide (TPR) repeat protein
VVAHFIGVPPERSGGLVGRTDPLGLAVDLLMREEDVAFVGLGGVGKSALASRLVRVEAVRTRLRDGVFWLSVGKTDAGAPKWRLQLVSWALALGMPPDRIAQAEAAGIRDETAGIRQLRELVNQGLADARALIVFDDVWRESDALLLKDFGAECRRILTTRMGGVASAFSPSGVVRVDDLPDVDARVLFDRLAPTVAHRRPETARSCISAVGRLPLVIVIVASYLQARVTKDPTCFDLVLNEVLDVRKRLELAPAMSQSSLTLLPEGSVATLNAVIGLSAKWLSAEAQDALTSLAIFPPKLNSFSWEAAKAVAVSLEAVITLREYSLVEDVTDEDRLTMHQTIHDYAIAGNVGDPAAYRRMAEHFLAYISSQRITAADAETWLSALEQEKDNITAVLQWTISQNETLLAYRLMSALWDYWYRRSRYERANQLADRILALTLADESKDTLLMRAKLLNDNGNFAFNMADLDKAERCHSEALSIRTRFSDDAAAGSLNNLGLVYRERGLYQEADDRFKSALKRNRDVGNTYWAALNLDNIGINERLSGNLTASATHLKDAAEIFARLGDRWGLAMTRIDLALTFVDQGMIKGARDVLVASLADRWQVEDQKLSASALRGLAAASAADHDVQSSLEFLKASLALSIAVLDRLGEYQSLIALVSVYEDEGHHREVARIAGILQAFRDNTGLTAQVGERAADAIRQSRVALGDTFDRLESEGRASAIADKGILDVENSVKPLLRGIDAKAIVADAISQALL